ncbi:hypothetical protein ACHAXR_008034 [Thalassiosira sp. AJA248-18]
MSMGSNGGIGRRRGASAAGRKSPKISVIVFVAACSLTLFVFLILRYATTSTMETRRGNGVHSRWRKGDLTDAQNYLEVAEKADDLDEEVSKQFRKWGAIIRADSQLVAIQTSGITKNKNGGYQGVKAQFCKIDWEKYKKDPPSLPMFKFLVSESGCDNSKNLVTMDLATVVQKTREYDNIRRSRGSGDDVHVIPPAGFVFHESRVGSTLVANALTAMDPDGHRVYSESHPINEALKAFEGTSDNWRMDTSAQLFRDVVYMMGRTASPKEKHMFFKVSSIGSKRIDVMIEAFPSVPWIFVYRDPVQTMMSHLDPAKLAKKVRGGGSPAVCLRSKKHPPGEIVQLAHDHGSMVSGLSNEEFCAAHLASLCESALRGLKESNGKGVAVEYDGLVQKLIQTIIPKHFSVDVDEAARQRILDVSTKYSKSKAGTQDWVEDSETKDSQSTPMIRRASETYLSDSYSKLQEFNMK